MNKPFSEFHIAIYCSSESWGGLEKNSIELAIQLKSMGYDVTVFGLKNASFSKFAEQHLIRTSFIKRNMRYTDLSNALKLRTQFQSHRITHCIFRDPRDISIIGITHFFYPRFKVIYYQAMQLNGPKKSVPHRIRFSQINAWVCTSNTLKDQVFKYTNVSAEKLYVIPLQTKIPERTPVKQTLFEMFNIPQSQKRIGCVGRLDPKKDQLTLLKSFLSISEKTDWNLVFIGDNTFQEGDEYANTLRIFVNENQLADRVFFIPYQENIHAVYESIDLFVLPSISETFGTVTIEAMAHGLAILGTNSGATPELLNQPEQLFEPQNVNELATKMLELINNDTLRNEVGLLNANRFQELYSETTFQVNWNKLLNQL